MRSSIIKLTKVAFSILTTRDDETRIEIGKKLRPIYSPEIGAALFAGAKPSGTYESVSATGRGSCEDHDARSARIMATT